MYKTVQKYAKQKTLCVDWYCVLVIGSHDCGYVSYHIFEMETEYDANTVGTRCYEINHYSCGSSFYRAAMSCQKKAVCPSVRRVLCDKTEERYVKIFIAYDISFSLVF